VCRRLGIARAGEVCLGLYAAGMVVAALNETPRMDPIFGG